MRRFIMNKKRILYGVANYEELVKDNDDLSRLDQPRTWIIDPVDGSGSSLKYLQSYEEKFSYFAVHIGLAIGHEPILGVVYVPARKELFYAIKNQGAYQVTENELPKKVLLKTDLKSPIEFAGSMYNNRNEQLVNLVEAERQIHGNVFGYCLMSVAIGKTKAHVARPECKTEIGEWDICAPSVIINEAGGIITDFYGDKFKFNQKELYRTDGVCTQASNGIIPWISSFPK